MFMYGKMKSEFMPANKVFKNASDMLPIIGQQILDDAEETIPFDTGELQDSGFVNVIGDHVQVGYTVPYAEVHEFGRKDGKKFNYQKASAKTGWLRITLLRNQPKYVAIMVKGTSALTGRKGFIGRFGGKLSRLFGRGG